MEVKTLKTCEGYSQYLVLDGAIVRIEDLRSEVSLLSRLYRRYVMRRLDRESIALSVVQDTSEKNT
jgi:hypothetical protein